MPVGTWKHPLATELYALARGVDSERTRAAREHAMHGYPKGGCRQCRRALWYMGWEELTGQT